MAKCGYTLVVTSSALRRSAFFDFLPAMRTHWRTFHFHSPMYRVFRRIDRTVECPQGPRAATPCVRLLDAHQGFCCRES